MARSSERRSYGGKTGDERAADRRIQLLDAAFGLVAESGISELSIDGLCREAGLNKRYFYESFENLDDLAAGLTSRIADEAIAVATEGIGPGDPAPDTIRSAVTRLTVYLTDDTRRAAVLFGAVPMGDGAAGHRAQTIRRVIGVAIAQGTDSLAMPAGPGVGYASSLLVGGSSQVILDWIDGELRGSREDLIDQLVSLWTAVHDDVVARGDDRHS